MLELTDLFMVKQLAEREDTPDGTGFATVSYAFGGPDVDTDEGEISVTSAVIVELKRGDDEIVVAKIESDYHVIFRWTGPGDAADWNDHLAVQDLYQASLNETHARHRERILESTMRMGIPLFRLELQPLRLEGDPKRVDR